MPMTQHVPKGEADMWDPERVRAAVQTLQEFGRTITTVIREAVAAAAPHLALFGEVMVLMCEALDRLPPRLRAVVVASAHRGWYIPWDVPLCWIMHLEEAIGSTDADTLDAILCGVFKEYPDRVIQSASCLFPHRAEILQQAMQAHACGHYGLSVLAFLSQAEGIARDSGLPDPFSNPSDHHALLRDAKADSMVAVLLAPLVEADAIRLGEKALKKQRSADPRSGELNRHEVVHGYGTGYGTLANSMKAVLLIEYILRLRAHLVQQQGMPPVKNV